MRALPCGEAAVLLEFDDLDQVLAAYRWARAADLFGVEELVPAARTLLVIFDRHATQPDEVVQRFDARPETPPELRTDAAVVEVPVVYDGDDLEVVAEHTGLEPRGVVAAHTGQLWTVAFAGFAPGFGYLVGEDRRLQVPRRDDPRAAVPAGMVGLADVYSGIYPRRSPGGWQLIGHTDLELWDLERDPPAVLEPGVGVRFVEVT